MNQPIMKNWQYINPAELVPYELNAKYHDAAQIAAVAESITKYGWAQPIVVDAQNVIIIGHCRQLAALQLGLKQVPVIVRDDLTPEQARELRIVDNKSNESAWDMLKLKEDLTGLDLSGFAFSWDLDFPADGQHFWGDAEGESNEEYEAFEEKFKPKKTTDDCYTPENVYNAVRDWAVKYFRLGKAKIVRPFYPGGDYQHEQYPPGCVVIDNPPFSILSEICRWYRENNIRFFLFAPSLTLFSTGAGEFNYYPSLAAVEYENGAVVATSFITNLGKDKIAIIPELIDAVTAANNENTKSDASELDKYVYPENLIHVAAVNTIARRSIELKLKPEDCSFIRALDAQREQGKAIFGAGFLLSKKAAAEKAAAEKAAAEKAAAEKAAVKVWELSAREVEIAAALGCGLTENTEQES